MENPALRLDVGCAMWTLGPWRGRYLPHPLPAEERLRAYASWCTAVEGNTTFYAVPSRQTAEMWARQVDESFRFVLKIPKTVSHERRLTGVEQPMRAFLDAVEPLEKTSSALWVQLPGSFGPGDVPVLAAFLRRLPRGFGSAVEVRHPAFFTDPAAIGALERALARTGTEWVPFDTVAFFEAPPTSDAERDAWTKKPRLPRRATALTGRPVVRYLGRDDDARTVEGWRFWVETAAGWLREGRSPTVFVHTPDNVRSLPLARRFHDEVRALVPALAPLPEPLPAEPPALF
ncbi:DUF72 domain-containing protein [Actinocorallia lasiicapitis]